MLASYDVLTIHLNLVDADNRVVRRLRSSVDASTATAGPSRSQSETVNCTALQFNTKYKILKVQRLSHAMLLFFL